VEVKQGQCSPLSLCYGDVTVLVYYLQNTQMRFFEKSRHIRRLKMFRREDRAWETEV
jgi:hypothetical protein